VLARAARARVKWVRSSSLLLAAQESHAGQLGPRQLPCGGVVKEGTVCRAVLASQGPSSHLPHGGRGGGTMGEQADFLTEQHIEAIAQGIECGECGANLEVSNHAKWCKIGKQEDRRTP